MTPNDFEALRAIVQKTRAEHLQAIVRHLYRLKGGMTMGAASAMLLTELGMPGIDAAECADAAMSERLDRSARLKVAVAPHAAPEAASIARAADLVLIPCRPTAFDLAAAGSAAAIVKAAGARAAFVLSACPVRAPEIAETRAALLAYGLPVAPAEITDRRAFSRAIATGRAVTEFEADGRAADEIRALWDWIGTQIA